MPGEFYIEGKTEKISLSSVETSLFELQEKVDDIQRQVSKLTGESPVSGSVVSNWQMAEAEVVTIGTHNSYYKLHSLLISIHNLAGTVITIRLYMLLNGNERKVYQQSFDASADTAGLWVVNGTVGIHEVLRITLESNNAADNGKDVHYDYLLEAM